jgi:hypothetical protein
MKALVLLLLLGGCAGSQEAHRLCKRKTGVQVPGCAPTRLHKAVIEQIVYWNRRFDRTVLVYRAAGEILVGQWPETVGFRPVYHGGCLAAAIISIPGVSRLSDPELQEIVRRQLGLALGVRDTGTTGTGRLTP